MTRKFLTLILSTLMVVGCAKEADSGASSQGSTQNQTNTQEPSKPGWESVSLEGKVEKTGSKHNQTLVVVIDKVQQALILVLPIPLLGFQEVNTTQIEGVKLIKYTNSAGNVFPAVSIPLKLVLKGASFLPNEVLPNGDDLPFVPAGELPGFALDLPQIKNRKFYVYIGVNVVAVFAETPELDRLPLQVGFTLPVKNKEKTKVVGALSYVIPKGVHSSGFFVASQLPADLARLINDVIKWN